MWECHAAWLPTNHVARHVRRRYGAGVSGVALDVVPLGGSVSDTVARGGGSASLDALSIERCGRSADGAPRNMRGEDISAFATPLDDLFVAGPWQRIAIGDGGNEIGMGSCPLR